MPAFELVLVLNQVLAHVSFHIWEDGDDLVELVFVNVADIRVTIGGDGCSSSLVRDESDLSEVVAWCKLLNKDFLLVLIIYNYLTLSRGDKIQVLSDLSLPNDVLLRVKHLELHF